MNSKVSDYGLQERFLKGETPKKGESNNFFYEAALACKGKGLDKITALEKIRITYDKWERSEYFSDRPWSNIVVKVEEVYR